MSRYIRNEAIGKPADFVNFIMSDFIQKHGFTLVNINGETMYQKGKGFLEMPRYFSYRYMNGVIHIEAWVKFAWFPGVYGKENDLSGGVGAIPKNAYREDIDELIRVLYQPLPGEQQNPYGGYGQSMPGGVPNGYGQTAPNGMANGYGQSMPGGVQNSYGQPAPNGMVNSYGQPVPNGMANGYGQSMPGGVQNGYGQTAPNGMANGYGQSMPGGVQNGYGQTAPNGMVNSYGQPIANGPITVRGVDMKKRAKTGFTMSILGIVFFALTALLAMMEEGMHGYPVWMVWSCSMVYAGLGIGYCYRGMSSSKSGLATGGFVIGILEVIVGVLMLIFGVV